MFQGSVLSDLQTFYLHSIVLPVVHSNRIKNFAKQSKSRHYIYNTNIAKSIL